MSVTGATNGTGMNSVGADTILSIRNLTKTYPNGVQALKGVSFDVKRGEFLVVIGLSGSGKSTMLRCLNRLHHPTSGEVLYRSKEGSVVDIAAAEGEEILNGSKEDRDDLSALQLDPAALGSAQRALWCPRANGCV